MAYYIENNVILQNHAEIIKIIDSYIYLAAPDEALIKEIKLYNNHVSVYNSLRNCGNETKFPFDLQVPFPLNFYPLIKQRTEYYQDLLNKKMFFNKN